LTYAARLLQYVASKPGQTTDGTFDQQQLQVVELLQQPAAALLLTAVAAPAGCDNMQA
jgi:hypothetical protein